MLATVTCVTGVLRPVVLDSHANRARTRVRRLNRHAQLYFLRLGLLGKQIFGAVRVQMALAGEQAHDTRVRQVCECIILIQLLSRFAALIACDSRCRWSQDKTIDIQSAIFNGVGLALT